MQKRKKVVHLIDSLSSDPSPFYILFELLMAEFTFLKKIKKFRCHPYIFNPDPRLFEQGGYKGIEFNLWGAGIFDDEWSFREERLEMLKRKKFPLKTFHACFEALPRQFLGNYLNLAEKNDYTRRGIKAQIDAARELGGEGVLLVLHPGKVRRKNDKKEGLKNLIDNFSFAIDYAKSKKVTLTMENLGYLEKDYPLGSNAEELLFVKDKIGEDLKFTFDVGHANTILKYNRYAFNGNKIQRDFVHIKNFIKALGKSIIHVHLHYNMVHREDEFSFARVSGLKKLFLNLFFWTKTAQLIREKYQDIYDQHLPLVRLKEEERKGFFGILKCLSEETSLSDFGLITHEIAPKKLFNFFVLSEGGPSLIDHFASLKLIKDII